MTGDGDDLIVVDPTIQSRLAEGKNWVVSLLRLGFTLYFVNLLF